jgi:integrase
LIEAARKRGRNGPRDAAAILLAYRHGLRAAELCQLRWAQIDLRQGRLHVNLATVRLQDQPLADAFLEEHRNLAALGSRVEGVEPTIHEEDMPTLLDGLTVELILSSDYFRGRLCAAFRRAAEARNVSQFLVQIVDWLRDEFNLR